MAETYPRGGADIWDDGPAGEVLSNDIFQPPASVLGQIKVWLGAWVAKPVKVWMGAWVQKPVRIWNGTSWVETTY